MREERLFKKYHREQVAQKRMDSHILLWLLGYLKPYRAFVGLAIALLVFAKMIEAFVPLYIGLMTRQIMEAFHGDLLQKGAAKAFIIQGSLWALGLLLLAYLFDTLSMYIKNRVGQRAVSTLRFQAYERILHMPMAYHDKNAVGRLITRTIHDVDQVNQMMTESVVPIFGSLILFTCMVIGIAIMDWRVALIFLGLMPVVLWLTNYFRSNQRRWYDIIRNILTSMNAFVQEHLSGASTVRYFGLEVQEKKRFDHLNEDFHIANLETVKYFSLFIAGIDFLQSLSLILVFVTLILFAVPGSGLNIGTFFTFNLYAIMFFRPLSDLAERFNVLQSAISAAVRIYDTVEQPSECFEEGYEGVLDRVETISFEDVWFAYEGENWVLKGLTFEIREGESVAFVGMTGAGKSSIISLLLRFYDIQQGTIRVNGKDIREYPLHALRRLFGLVLQDPVIFSGNIEENITLHRPEIHPEVREAVQFVSLQEFISRFPDGLHHKLNGRGQTLSAGEMQLISLARAVASGRKVLVLDEATANIDSATEKLIQQVLEKLLFQRTALVIAHRLSTIKDVHRILVINEGRIVESGSHQELIQLKGIYEKLYRIQSL